MKFTFKYLNLNIINFEMNIENKPFDDQMQLNECSEQYLYENVSSEMINPSFKFLPIYTNNETNYSDLKQNINNN